MVRTNTSGKYMCRQRQVIEEYEPYGHTNTMVFTHYALVVVAKILFVFLIFELFIFYVSSTCDTLCLAGGNPLSFECTVAIDLTVISSVVVIQPHHQPDNSTIPARLTQTNSKRSTPSVLNKRSTTRRTPCLMDRTISNTWWSLKRSCATTLAVRTCAFSYLRRRKSSQHWKAQMRRTRVSLIQWNHASVKSSTTLRLKSQSERCAPTLYQGEW